MFRFLFVYLHCNKNKSKDMEILIYVVNDFTDERIHRFYTEYMLIPNVNDTISLCSVGDFVVARREFGYVYDNEYGSQELSYILLRVYPKPTDKEE